MKKTFKILALCFALLVVFSSVCFATDVVTTSQEGGMPIAETLQSSGDSETTTILNINSSV